MSLYLPVLNILDILDIFDFQNPYRHLNFYKLPFVKALVLEHGIVRL